MPFADYANFKDCVQKNKDKGDPEAYCGKIKHQVEGSQNEDENSVNIYEEEARRIVSKLPEEQDL